MDKVDKNTIFKIYYNTEGTITTAIVKEFQGGMIEVGFINLKTNRREYINHRYYLRREMLEKMEDGQ